MLSNVVPYRAVAARGAGGDQRRLHVVFRFVTTVMPLPCCAVSLQAEVKEVASADPISEWAARVTKGLITTAVPPGTAFDLVLTNAVYFKGECADGLKP